MEPTNRSGRSAERRTLEAHDLFAKTPAVSPEHFWQTYLSETGAEVNDSAQLLQWSRETGRIIRSPDMSALYPYSAKVDTKEHFVYFLPDADKVIKVVQPGKWGSEASDRDYFHNLENMNRLTCGHLKIEVIGVLPMGRWPSVVTRMKFIEGGHPDPWMLEDKLAEMGFEKPNPNARYNSGYVKYRHAASGVELLDAHSGNFILTQEGTLIPIDLHLRGNFLATEVPKFGGFI